MHVQRQRDSSFLVFCSALLTAYSLVACSFDVTGPVAVTLMSQAGKERRMHGQKENKHKQAYKQAGKENEVNKPKCVMFQGLNFFPAAVSDASVASDGRGLCHVMQAFGSSQGAVVP